jgi:hypothetical protein
MDATSGTIAPVSLDRVLTGGPGEDFMASDLLFSVELRGIEPRRIRLFPQVAVGFGVSYIH